MTLRRIQPCCNADTLPEIDTAAEIELAAAASDGSLASVASIASDASIASVASLASVKRRRVLGGVVALLAMGIVPGVGMRRALASPMFPFIPDHYTFSHDQVYAAVARKFPYHRALAQVFDLALTNPVIGFEPDVNRVAISANVALTSPFLNEPVTGSLTLNTELAYDAPSLSVQLKSPQVERTELDASAQQYKQQVDAALAVAAQQLLSNYPIYTFKPDQLTFAGARFEPGAITVLKNGIKVEIVQVTQ